MLSNRLLKLYSANQNAVRIAEKGSMNKELKKLALSIFSVCLQSKIKLETE